MTLPGETETQARVGGYIILIVTEKMKVTIPPPRASRAPSPCSHIPSNPLLGHQSGVWEAWGCGWPLQSCPALSLQPQDFRLRVSPQNKPDSQFWGEVPFLGRPERPMAASRLYSCLSLTPSPDLMPGPADPAAREGLAAPPRRARARKVSCPLTRSNGDLVG